MGGGDTDGRLGGFVKRGRNNENGGEWRGVDFASIIERELGGEQRKVGGG